MTSKSDSICHRHSEWQKNASKMHQKTDNLWFNEHEYYMKINERRQQKSKVNYYLK